MLTRLTTRRGRCFSPMLMKYEGPARRRGHEERGPRGPESSLELAAFAGLIAGLVGLGILLFTHSLLLSALVCTATFIVTFAAFHVLRIIANGSDQYSKRG
jgi:hypothetical protein